MLKQFSLLSVLATLANAIYVGEEPVFVAADRTAFGPTIQFAPNIPLVEMNSPSMRGTMSFTNLTAHGTETVELTANYDPVEQLLILNLGSKRLDLVANYTANLHFVKNDTFVRGEGRFAMTTTGYHLRNGQWPVRFVPKVRKFQLSYPLDFDPEIESMGLEITGLKNAMTGADINVLQLSELLTAHEKPGFVEIWRAIGNFNMKRGYAQQIGNAFLHSFFDSPDPY